MSSQSKCRICGHSDSEYSSLTNSVHNTYPPYLSPFMTSNMAPSDQAKAQIEQDLIAETEQLAQLDCQIANLRLQLDALVQRRVQKQSNISDCKFALHPIRRLPRDVLCEIFLSFVAEISVHHIRHGDVSSINPKGTIWILPRVSKQWHEIALSLPRLWSTIRLLGADFRQDFNGIANTSFMLGTQIQRSRNHLLSVIIITQTRFPSVLPVLQVLFSTAGRWKELALYIPFSSFNSLERLPALFSELTTVHIWPNGQYSADHLSTSPLRTMFQYCPKLSGICTYPKTLNSIILPLDQIQKFECVTSPVPTTASSIDALMVLPNLRIYRTVSEDRGDNNIQDLQQVTLDELEEMTIINSEADRPLLFLRLLSAPSLRSFSVINLPGIDHLLPFLQNTGRQLRCLSLQSKFLTDADCVKVLGTTPCLTSLTLECPLVYTDMFVERLLSTDGPQMLPSLAFLELVGYPEFEAVDVLKLKEVRPELAFLGGGFVIR